MQVVDLIILVLVFMFALVGAKRGFFKQTVMTVGAVLVFVFAYYFKDYLANWFSYNLPFFNFQGDFLGLSTVNIIMYQMLAFIIMVALFSTVFAMLLKITGIFEKILKMTIILSIPSKILGFVVGIIEGYVIIFIALFFLSQPAVKFRLLDDSKLMPIIVNSSPVLSKVVKNTSDSIEEMYYFVKDYTKDKDSDKFNRKSIDIMLKNKIISIEYVDKLISKNKIKIFGIDDILNNYR